MSLFFLLQMLCKESEGTMKWPGLLMTEWCHCWLAGRAWISGVRLQAPLFSENVFFLARDLTTDNGVNTRCYSRKKCLFPLDVVCRAFLVPCFYLVYFLKCFSLLEVSSISSLVLFTSRGLSSELAAASLGSLELAFPFLESWRTVLPSSKDRWFRKADWWK